MKTKKTEFVVFCNKIIGESIKASSVQDAIDKMLKRQKEYWSTIEWRDEDGKRMVVTQEYLDQGMTLEEIIEDWKMHASSMDFDDIIITFRKGAIKSVII